MPNKPFLLVLPSNTVVTFRDDEFTIGRSLVSGIVIPSPLVSRNQCVIKKKEDEDKWIISDLSSYRSTCVNGEPISSDARVLSEGDVISIRNYNDQEFKFLQSSSSSQDGIKKRKISDVIDLSVLDPSNVEAKHQRELLDRCSALESEKQDLCDKLHYYTVLSENTQKSLRLLETEMRVLKGKLLQEEQSKELLNCKVITLEESLKEIKNERESFQAKIFNQKFERVDRGTEPFSPEELEAQNFSDFNEDIIEGDYYSTFDYACPSPLCSALDAESQNEILKVQDDGDEKSSTSCGKTCDLKNQVDRVETHFLEAENAALISELEKKNREIASVLNEKETFRSTIIEVLEHELLCGVCNDILFQPVTLNCKHTFCKVCIIEWKKKKKDCPVCRTKIKHEVCNLVLDSFIDKAAEILGEEFQTRRNEVKLERKDPEKNSPQSRRGRQKRRSSSRVLFPSVNQVNFIAPHRAGTRSGSNRRNNFLETIDLTSQVI